ncbi:MAG: MerR family transcriptional regulator [Burkholderiales bacterium]|nr:MerR family transcriptional regulator [Burkholderiales bacterium]MBH2016266.1 MerR family transcriptional regulator [Burkholderiales bacterium]
MTAPPARPKRTPPHKPARTDAVTGLPGEMTVEALAERTGVSVRNIRAYQTAGLIAPPRLHGRTGLYDAEHQGKLELIRDLRKQGFKLDAIKGMLDDTPAGAWTEYALINSLFSTTFFTVEKPQRKALSEMAAHWAQPATQAQKDRLSENGLYRRLAADEVEMLSPSLERIGIQLAELDVPLDTVLDLQDELIRHSRAIAQVYVRQLFLAMVRTLAEHRVKQQSPAGHATNPSVDPALAESIKGLFERLRPLAIGSVTAAFPVILQQEFDRAVQEALKRPS